MVYYECFVSEELFYSKIDMQFSVQRNVHKQKTREKINALNGILMQLHIAFKKNIQLYTGAQYKKKKKERKIL